MSKTKFVALAAVAFAFAFVVSSAFAATWDFGSSTIKKGSSGMYAMNIQTALNACNNAGLTVDGKFGAHSAAALVAFQASKGLTADGKAGNMTKAALNNCGSTTTTTTTTTGGTTTTTTNNSGAPLSINQAQAQSGYYNTAVGVGQVDKQIANIRLVTGAGGAGNLTGLNVSFYNMGAGDYQFTKYAQSVSIWLNGTKVGTIPSSQFSQYNSIYSAFVPVSGAILNANSTNNLVLSVSALPTIDSTNMTSDAWGVDVTSIRYSDSSGVFTYNPGAIFGAVLSTTSTTTSQNTYFQFASAASAQSIKLTVTRNVGDSSDSVVVGSASATTQGVKLAMVDLNAQGDTINLHRLPVTLSVGNGATLAASVINTLRLYDAAGNQLDSQAITTGGTQTVTFQNLNVNVNVNSTATFTIKGDFNTVGGAGFPAGSSAAVSVSSSNVNNIQAYDSGSNVLSGTSYLTGSTTGNNVAMYVNGVNVTAWGTPTTNVANPGGAQTHSLVTYTIPFSVTAFGSVAYLPSVAAAATSASAANAIQFCVDATTACAAAGTGSIQYSGSDTFLATSTGGTYQLPIGQPKNFNLIVTYSPSSGIATRAQLLNVNWSLDGSTFSTYTSGLGAQAFKTPTASAQ